MVLATQHQALEEGSNQFNQDLKAVHKYYNRKWCLKTISLKSEVSALHLSNKLAHTELQVMFGGERLRYNSNPTYLGDTQLPLTDL